MAFGLDLPERAYMIPLTVELISTYPFLSIDLKNNELRLQAQSSDSYGTYEDAYLEFISLDDLVL